MVSPYFTPLYFFPLLSTAQSPCCSHSNQTLTGDLLTLSWGSLQLSKGGLWTGLDPGAPHDPEAHCLAYPQPVPAQPCSPLPTHSLSLYSSLWAKLLIFFIPVSFS